MQRMSHIQRCFGSIVYELHEAKTTLSIFVTVSLREGLYWKGKRRSLFLGTLEGIPTLNLSFLILQ